MNLNAILSQIFSIHLCLYVTLFCLLLEVNCDQDANEWKLYKELGGTPMDLLNKLDDKRGINLGRKMMCRMDPRNCAGLLSDSSPYQRNVVYRRAEGFLHSDDSQRDSLSRATESRLPIFSDRRY